MGDVREVQLQIKGSLDPPPRTRKDNDDDDVVEDFYGPNKMRSSSSMFKHWQWWLAVFLCTFSVIAGQTIATLLGRLYYNDGGNSLWLATLVQSAGSPLLIIPLLLFPSSSSPSTTNITTKIVAIYILLGLMISGDNLMYSYGLLYLPVSTYSLVCATQLAFNAVFSYFLNNQKFTPLIFNSVVLLTFSAALLGVSSDSDGSADIPKGKYPLGFVLTVGASATFSLILSLFQRTFEKVFKSSETFSVVLEIQMYTNIVAACGSTVGLFASGDWKGLTREMHGYEKGEAAYIATLVGIAVAWQVSSVGTVGLIFIVSSLFSNVICTLALPVIPIFAVVFFHDKMDGVKVVAMLIAVWGFLSYIYQHYVDDSKANKAADIKTDTC